MRALVRAVAGASRDQRALRRRKGRGAAPRRGARRHRDADPARPARAGAAQRRVASISGSARPKRSRLAAAAREGKATRDELSGSTITITSLGALGGVASTPIINYPEVAIVGVNRIMRAAGGARRAGRRAQDDEPLLVVRSPRGRRLERRRVHPEREAAARAAGDALRGVAPSARTAIQFVSTP